MSFYAYFLFKSLKYKKRPKNKKRSRNELKDIFNKKVEFSLACIILLFCLTSGVYETFDLINKDFQEIGGNIKKIENAYRDPFSQGIAPLVPLDIPVQRRLGECRSRPAHAAGGGKSR
jgi:hypothetical protein